MNDELDLAPIEARQIKRRQVWSQMTGAADIDALLTEVKRLRAEVDELRKLNA